MIHSQLQPQRAGYFHDGRKLRVALGRKRLVQPLPRQPRVFGKLCHTSGTGDYSQRVIDQTPVAFVFFYAGVKVELKILLGSEKLGGIPAAKALGDVNGQWGGFRWVHDLLLPDFGKFNSTVNVFGLGGFITAAQQHDDGVTAPREIQAITCTHINPHLRNTIAQKFIIAKVAQQSAVNACIDAGDGNPVFELESPIDKFLRFDNFKHGLIVNHRLQCVKHELQITACNSKKLRYNSLVTSKKGVIEIGVSVESAARAATGEYAAFCIVPPFMAAHSRSRKARQLLLRRFTGTPTRLGCRPDWRRGGSCYATEPSEAIMANSLTPFNFGQSTIRTTTIGDAVWFVCTDVAEALGYRNAPDASRHLDDDEKGTQIVRTLGGDQTMTIINESGLYALVLRSRKPEARKFAKWVTGEVLPTIRKKGGYAQQPALADAISRLEVFLARSCLHIRVHFVCTALEI